MTTRFWAWLRLPANMTLVSVLAAMISAIASLAVALLTVWQADVASHAARDTALRAQQVQACTGLVSSLAQYEMSAWGLLRAAHDNQDEYDKGAVIYGNLLNQIDSNEMYLPKPIVSEVYDIRRDALALSAIVIAHHNARPGAIFARIDHDKSTPKSLERFSNKIYSDLQHLKGTCRRLVESP
jgi:hypothetical protein